MTKSRQFKVFNSRLSKNKQNQAFKLLEKFHSENYEIEIINNQRRKDGEPLLKSRSGASLIRELEQKKLLYTKDNIYYDIRRHAAYYKSKTSEKAAKAQEWFDNYFEPFRKEKGLTAKEAHKLWLSAKEQTYEALSSSELQYALELREIGSP